MKKLFLFAIFIAMIFPIVGYAEETTTADTSCNYNSKAYLNKIASSVKMAYEFKYDESGNVSFDISIYNIKDDIYISLQNSLTAETKEIFSNMTQGGTYTFNEKNTSDIITYTAEIRTTKFGCYDTIRKISIIKPKRNELSDEYICSDKYAAKLMYCQEWISQEFSVSTDEALEIINHEIEKHEPKEEQCIDCEKTEEEVKKEKTKKTIKKYLIISLIIGIVIDTATIIIMTIRIRRYSI